MSLTLASEDDGTSLSGHIENIVLEPLDGKTVQPTTHERADLPALILEPGTAIGDMWSGVVRVAPIEVKTAPDGFPEAGSLVGDWHASVHGPTASEAAGRLRLWTPLNEDADVKVAWSSQAILVAGFGAIVTTEVDQ